jgi:hypothetical protein
MEHLPVGVEPTHLPRRTVDDVPPIALTTDARDVPRAINERRARTENRDLLRLLRSL